MRIEFFIQANNKQLIGAKIAQAAIMRQSGILPTILNVSEATNLGLQGLRYKRDGKWVNYNASDLQSFTLVRFLPPTIMNFEGFSLIIDPDIFAIRNLSNLISLTNEKDFSVLACKKKEFFDSSVMIINNEKFSSRYSWKKIIENLSSGVLDYKDLMSLNIPNLKVKTLDRIFNSLDSFSSDTVFIHTTNRLTQPWKTGLKIDFTRNNPGYYFSLIPKKPVFKILGKYPSRYKKHPDPKVEDLFFDLARSAIKDGYLSIEEIKQAMNKGFVRKDFLRFIS
jgi:hypothetical protein